MKRRHLLTGALVLVLIAMLWAGQRHAGAQITGNGFGSGGGGGGGGTPGGTSGQIQYNNSSAFGGFTASGDATINTSTGAVAVKTATTNVPPAYISQSTASGASGTTLTIGAPTSITNGNALLAFIACQGATSETWTPATGFNQIGSTLVSIANGKMIGATFCKTAASESGSYVFSWNNSCTGSMTGQIVNISGASCTPDTTTAGSNPSTVVGNASTRTLTGFTPTTSGDILVAFAGQNTGRSYITPGPALNFITNTGTGIASVYTTWGSAAIPNFQMLATNVAGGIGSPVVNDFVGMLVGLPPSATASTPITAGGTSTSLNAGNFANNITTTGVTYGIGGFLVNNNPSNAGNDTVNCYASERANGTPMCVLAINSANAVQLDPAELSTFVTLGSGSAATATDTLLTQPSGIAVVSSDAAQDLWLEIMGTDNSVHWGCDATTTKCPTITETADNYFATNANHQFHFCFNNAAGTLCSDTEELMPSLLNISLAAVSTPSGMVVTPTGGSATQRCYRAACVSGTYFSLAEVEVCDAAGPTTLDATHFETVTVPLQAGCGQIQFYGRATGAEAADATALCPGGSGCTVNGSGKISFKDTGVATFGGASPLSTSTNTGHYDITSPSVDLLGGSTLQSTGGAAPTVTCSGGSTGTSVTAGSTNNRGSFVSSSSASTNCTLTWSAAGIWNQAPFCHFFDAGASITPITYSMGACGTSTCIVDFASTTSKTIGYMCM